MLNTLETSIKVIMIVFIESTHPVFCRAIPQTESAEVTVTVSERNCGERKSIQYLEHVVVVIRAKFDRRGYLEGYLTSPNGTESYILPFRPNDVLAQNFDDWPILSLHFWGENPKGTWRLRFKNHYPQYHFTGSYFLYFVHSRTSRFLPLKNGLPL